MHHCQLRPAVDRIAALERGTDTRLPYERHGVDPAAPTLLALPGVGPEVAGQLLTTAGDNPERITSEAAFAHLCGAAPIPASSGRTYRHRLNPAANG